MLSNEDLLAISMVLDEKNKPIHQRLDRLETKIINVETTLRKEIKSVETTLRNEIKNVETTLRNEIKNVETTLGNQIHNINLVLENEIRPNIRLLAENYPDLEAMRKTTEYNESLKIDIDLLKKVVTEHSEQIQMLQKIS